MGILLFVAMAFLVEGHWVPTSPSVDTYTPGPFRVQLPAGVFDNETQEMWIFGGRGIGPAGGFDYIKDVWAYNTQNDTWRNASAAGGPSARQAAQAAFGQKKVWIFGGLTASGSVGDFFAYDTQGESWTQVVPGNSGPSARFGGSAVFEPADRLWFFSGGNSGSFDVWTFDIAGNSWAQRADAPMGARSYHSSLFENGRVWIFGGTAGSAFYNDLWLLDIQADTWTNMTTADGPPPRRSHAAALSQAQNIMWIHGGYFYDYDLSQQAKRGDVWGYDTGVGAWTEVMGPAVVRYQHVAVVDWSDRMFIYAGTGSSSVTDSVDVFLTALTTTTTTTTTLAVATAADALAAIEDFQSSSSTEILGMSLGSSATDGFTLYAREAPSPVLNGTVMFRAVQANSSASVVINYQQLRVELPASLVSALQAQGFFVISLAVLEDVTLYYTPGLLAPLLSLNIYTQSGEVTTLPQPLEITLPFQAPAGKFRTDCAYWDESLQAWSTEGVSVVRITADAVTCSTTHLSIFALILMVFICSNAAAIFSQEGFEALVEFQWLSQGPGLCTVLALVLCTALLLIACWRDAQLKSHRRHLVESWQSCQQAHLRKMVTKELPKEKLEIHPRTAKKFLYKHVHSQLLLYKLGVDVAFLKQLYVTGGFTPLHAQAKDYLAQIHARSLRAKATVLWLALCKWVRFSSPTAHSSSLERCAATLAKFWSGLALVALFYSTTALAANLPPECQEEKSLLATIVRGAVVAWLGAVVGFLPMAAVLFIQHKMIRSRLGTAARVLFWVFVCVYLLLSLLTIWLFLASVSPSDGWDFLVAAVTSVVRTILLTPWVAVAFFLGLFGCWGAGPDVALAFATVTGDQKYRMRLEKVAVAGVQPKGPISFNCHVPGHPSTSVFLKALEQEDQHLASGEVCWTGLDADQVVFINVYVKAKLLGSQGVRVQDLLDEGGGVRNLPLQTKAAEAASLRLTTALTVEEGQVDFPTLVDGDNSMGGDGGTLEELKESALAAKADVEEEMHAAEFMDFVEALNETTV
ncbi:unnamed protein product [Effrenium voratum]|nr:unnamed protein product [Effrenium voratum]